MPSHLTFDPFRRLRPRSNTAPSIPSSSKEDSDDSSPERDRPRVIHIPAPRNGRKSALPLVSTPENGKVQRGAPEKFTESTHITLSLDKPSRPARPHWPSKAPHKSVLSDAVDALPPPAKPTLIRRVTSKLHISIPLRSNTPGLRSRPSTRTLPVEMPPPSRFPFPRATIAVSPPLPNSFTSAEHREAALRERGLLPPRKDLSEQERETDRRLGCFPSPASTSFDGVSEAELLKTSWLAANRTSEGSASDYGPPFPPYLQGTRSCPQSMSALPLSSVSDTDGPRQSGERNMDSPPAGRPSICSSVSPISVPSYLEVLHEDPSEQGPLPPPSSANVPIIVSSSSVVESPTSFTFSSRLGSTVESQSQSDHPPVPEKERKVRSPARSRTSDSGDRGRRLVGPPLTGLGTRSLSNLRRSVVGSFGLQSSTTLSSADPPHSAVQAPRTPISPTMYSLGSILREARGIEDVESRRLSELAFLD